ncbi:MAG: hypothetical protein AB7V45_04545 [Candidatus Krumholzibacteriia bacterium]
MNETERDPLLRAAGELRRRGAAPSRDLWPDIVAAIDRLEVGGLRPAAASRSARRWPHLAAAAAVTVLCLMGPRTYGPPEHGAGAAPAGGLAAVDQALTEVLTALERDPANPNLNHLARRLHRSRAEVLLLESAALGRTALMDLDP